MASMMQRQAAGAPARPGGGPALPLRRPVGCRRPAPFSGRRRDGSARSAATDNSSDVDLEAQVEMFMKKQAEIESGAAFARTKNPDAVIGGDLVSSELAQQYCRDVFEGLKTLKRTRDMSLNEVKLIVMIEDPRAREMRAQGIEDDRGVSRDEMAAVLMEIAEGRVPKDRIALKCLYDDMVNWPFLEVGEASGGQGQATASTSSKAAPSPSEYAALAGGDSIAKPYVMGNDTRKGDKPQNLADMLPDWVGYGVLYGFSSIPVLLAVGVVLVLFFNSLK